MSRLGVIESSVAAKIATLVPGTFTYSKAVPADAIFVASPDAYPAALMCVERAKVTDWNPHNAGHIVTKLSVPIWVAVYASSDGVEIGDARSSAWSLVDAIHDALIGFVPSGFANPTSVWPVVPDNVEPFMIESGRYGILVPFHVDIQWLT